MNITVQKTYDNWLVLLRDLADGEFKPNSQQLTDIKQQAIGWPTCACGQLCNALPRNFSGSPADYNLHSWGLDFAGAVGTQRWALALDIFLNIEQRSSALLRAQNEYIW